MLQRQKFRIVVVCLKNAKEFSVGILPTKMCVIERSLREDNCFANKLQEMILLNWKVQYVVQCLLSAFLNIN